MRECTGAIKLELKASPNWLIAHLLLHIKRLKMRLESMRAKFYIHDAVSVRIFLFFGLVSADLSRHIKRANEEESLGTISIIEIDFLLNKVASYPVALVFFARLVCATANSSERRGTVTPAHSVVHLWRTSLYIICGIKMLQVKGRFEKLEGPLSGAARLFAYLLPGW